MIRIYAPGDGTVVIRWPADQIPDADTVRRVSEEINKLRNTLREATPGELAQKQE